MGFRGVPLRDPLAERNRTIDNYWAKLQAQAAVITKLEKHITKMQADDRELIAENVALREILADLFETTEFFTATPRAIRDDLVESGHLWPDDHYASQS